VAVGSVGSASVEPDVVAVESFAGGAGVGLGGGHLVGLRGWAGWSDVGAGGGGEDHAVGVVGVAGDAEVALVVHAVVVAAEADEVPGDGVAVVFPVGDVVDLDVGLAVAAGDAAAAVAVLDEAADAAGDDAVGAADLGGVAVGVPDGGDVAVAG
jgi:hypothetical protein